MAMAILGFRGTVPDNLMLPPYWWGSWELWECEILQMSALPFSPTTTMLVA